MIVSGGDPLSLPVGRLRWFVTELADMSLKDRHEQCKAAGLVGIPRSELLTYMHDAADALDVVRVDDATRDRFDRVLELAGFVEPVRVQAHRDVVHLGIQGLGEQKQKVVAYR